MLKLFVESIEIEEGNYILWLNATGTEEMVRGYKMVISSKEYTENVHFLMKSHIKWDWLAWANAHAIEHHIH